MTWNRGALEDFRRLVPGFVWLGCFIAVLSLLLVSHYVVVQRFPTVKSLVWGFSGVVIGTILAKIASHGRSEFWVYRILDPIPTDRKSIGWLLMGTVAAAAIASLDLFGDWSKAKDILDHHGSFFDWVIGSLTVVGIWLTYNTLTESQRIIRSFTQLQSRILALAKDTEADDSAGDMHFLAYTASIGFLALQKREWNKLRAALSGLGDRLKIICLDNDDLRSWHNQYIGRATSRPPADGGPILGLLDTIAATTASSVVISGSTGCKELKSEMMPGYYLIFNARRAIIITPFFVPQYPLPIGKLGTVANTNRVQMFGFETTDHRIIEDATMLFNHYGNQDRSSLHSDSQAGAVGDLPGKIAKKLVEWAAMSDRRGKCYRYRVTVTEDEPWPAILTYLRPKVVEDDFRKYLTAAEPYIANDKLSIFVEDNTQKKWIEDHCARFIQEAMTGLNLDMTFEVGVKGASAASGAGT